ncbi:CBS domain-containing protein [Hydrogenobacter hydrogenophilus]|uniref:tRNA nucleotidyltransferase (CCA-adding enzyme) n=1 Tax=Hydrogenobacter hydrogenophilus TaxID=35835 RepID=A0A285NV74_9AQUI|nr:CBS domain-containing protein [Hydrogenobacter hydrogenophilus]SNZ13394.1 tRNA nucleotidyltransferase (CCA-adding enzyme) [Hydrogenobacter hydrogenophilus]
MEKVIVLEEGADLDALSCAYGVQLLYPDSKLLRPKQLSKKAGEVFRDFKDFFRIIEELPPEFDLILVDTSNYKEYLEKLKGRVRSVIVYDHHPTKLECCEGKVEQVGSATTLVVEELMSRNVDITAESATLLSFGIYEDTGFLSYEGTTSRDARAIAWLLEKGANLRLIRKYLLDTWSKEQIDTLSKHLHSMESLFLNGKRVLIVVLKSEDYQPDVLNILYELREVKSADALFVIVSAGYKTYVFGRSIKGEFDVESVLERLGGGGHSFASAVKLEGVDAERVKSVLTSLLEGKNPPLRVKDVMTSPPFVLHQDTPVSNALLELSQRNFAGAPVVDDSGKLVGIVYKKNLLKVAKHYPYGRVKDFMVVDFHQLSPEDFIWKAEEILSHYGEKLIPVVENSNLVGVITRLDLLYSIREQTAEIKAHEKVIKLPTHVEETAKQVGTIAQELGFRAYLVGGVVRDILLKKEVWDIDFVIEGDAIKVAQRLAEKHGVDYHPFEEFRTAHIKVNGLKLEFATTRRETYPHPGAYPLVEYAGLKEDLLRRDFTINAMAVCVNPDCFGTLIDYFGGLRDLKDKLIRVLHPLSFVEDPVRILRALRFAGRLGFKLSKSTEKLLINAVSAGLIAKAPKGRLMNELRLALREERIFEILELYKKYGVLEHVLVGIRWSPQLEKKLLSLRDVIAWHRIEFPKEKIDYGWVYLLVLLEESEKGMDFLVDISAPAWVRETYEDIKKNKKELTKKLLSAQKNSEIYLLLKNKPLPFLLILMTEEDIKEKVRVYLEKLRSVKVDLEKFKGLSGRQLGKAIEEEKMKLMDAL